MEVKTCGTCLWFDAEDQGDWGFCDEMEVLRREDCCCPKWQEKPDHLKEMKGEKK